MHDEKKNQSYQVRTIEVLTSLPLPTRRPADPSRPTKTPSSYAKSHELNYVSLVSLKTSDANTGLERRHRAACCTPDATRAPHHWLQLGTKTPRATLAENQRRKVPPKSTLESVLPLVSKHKANTHALDTQESAHELTLITTSVVDTVFFRQALAVLVRTNARGSDTARPHLLPSQTHQHITTQKPSAQRVSCSSFLPSSFTSVQFISCLPGCLPSF